MTHTAAEAIDDSVMDIIDAMIAAAPDEERAIEGTTPAPRNIHRKTKVPARYRAEWHRPSTGTQWMEWFAKITEKCAGGGIVALTGPRGTGKTRLAAEAARNIAPGTATYATAMSLFLRIRASFGKAAKETEADIVDEMAGASLLILDEIQERGNTPWEDRILTHILDRRYGAMLPTIVIANLTEAALIECMGDSITSRLSETGGILAIDCPSHRIQP